MALPSVHPGGRKFLVISGLARWRPLGISEFVGWLLIGLTSGSPPFFPRPDPHDAPRLGLIVAPPTG
jgi:hypothetical protein